MYINNILKHGERERDMGYPSKTNRTIYYAMGSASKRARTSYYIYIYIYIQIYTFYVHTYTHTHTCYIHTSKNTHASRRTKTNINHYCRPIFRGNVFCVIYTSIHAVTKHHTYIYTHTHTIFHTSQTHKKQHIYTQHTQYTYVELPPRARVHFRPVVREGYVGDDNSNGRWHWFLIQIRVFVTGMKSAAKTGRFEVTVTTICAVIVALAVEMM